MCGVRQGVVVRAMRSAGVVLSECVVEGLDSDELRASICASVEDRACIRSYHSVFQVSYRCLSNTALAINYIQCINSSRNGCMATSMLLRRA